MEMDTLTGTMPSHLIQTEWLDTDKDGIGNNADPDDDEMTKIQETPFHWIQVARYHETV